MDLSPRKQPHVMTIAGSDSGGGAGIQADLKTIAAFHCYGTSVITALTAQNTLGVQAVHEVPSDFVVKQLRSVFDDEPPLTIKLGMLTSSSTITSLVDYLSKLPSRPPIILDPVMISTSGHTLLPDNAIEAIKTELLPFVQWITPNLPEAQRLCGNSSTLSTLSDMLSLADELTRKVPVPIILLKGGHLSVTRQQVAELVSKYPVVWDKQGDDAEDTIEILAAFRKSVGYQLSEELVVDILVEQEEKRTTLFVGRKIESQSTHGTGCTLSSAIASLLALKGSASSQTNSVIDICKRATAFTRSAIASAFPYGQGHGPLNHSHLTVSRPIPLPTSTDPHPFMTRLIQSNLPLWKSYVRHPFVVQLGEGTLPRECFQHYIKQDYHYLRHYARAHALGAFKAQTFSEIEAFTDIAKHVVMESSMHVEFCESFGISLSELQATPESAPNAAYSRYILDVGQSGDILDLYVAVASCLVGYGEVGLWLRKHGAKLEGNPYRRWIEDYSGPEYFGAIQRGITNLEQRIVAEGVGEGRMKRLEGIWQECVKLERDFWEMGLNKT
ncbi:putative phosphomethylpyrimidine kinase [Naematelia encephala]|uniref:Putative phosphomethylpyrimidine kinase n=1 Tax=Naematelia encephala TaxID=71784 RepID=A0A1Y2BBD4_9TREE|nr:putative phosphomethylpyrimidine kinase [Naematelia encephala]